MASKKKEVKEVVEAPEKAKFTKSQLISSKRYTHRKDLLNMLLKDDTVYDFDEVEGLIDDFMKGKVK
ncbi:hypothetical protein [Paenibacillus lentus]|uniref:Uncharacterized protein n=1 Tax=Paenibacillus lentus TaxID=1338368 RepID=A0A3S8S0Q0_9BACL|nr:hypothetical protein [Paenibacillus lentus]AZK48793.1 hypothetical protein EIM92_00005 [Paenibacillus lentus]